MLAIISGTQAGFENKSLTPLETAYGTMYYHMESIAGQQTCIVPRHGANHRLAPHQINYRAIIQGICDLHITQVLGICAVGSIKKMWGPGTMVLLDDFIDMTRGRIQTFYDDDEVRHISMDQPYSPEGATLLTTLAASHGISLMPGGIYVATDGPRFETAAEIRYYSLIGGHVVGMTNVPEVVLAKEAGLHYNALAVVMNYGTGFVDDAVSVPEDRVQQGMNRAWQLAELLVQANPTLPPRDPVFI